MMKIHDTVRESESGSLNAKGITLIALIVTIIVLLILAVVTLNTVLGNDGIIAKAQLAREKTNQSQGEEENKIKDLNNSLLNIYSRDTSIAEDDILWEGSIKNVNETANLKKSIENYKFLILETTWRDTSMTKDNIVLVDSIVKNGYDKTDAYDGQVYIDSYDIAILYINFKNSNSLQISGGNYSDSSYIKLTKIIGIK